MAGLDRALSKTNRRGTQPRPVVTPPSRSLLTESDFTYLGYYTLPVLHFDVSAYAQGPTIRYVLGQQRFLVLDLGGGSFHLCEIVLTGDPTPPGGGSATVTDFWFNSGMWPGSFTAGQANHNGIWYEEGVGLWWSTAGDYPDGPYTSNNVMVLSLRTLNDDHTGSNFQGFWGVEGLGTRLHYGGMRRVPAWFASTYDTGPYISGAGGYSSLFAQGLGACLGPFLVFIPNPIGITENPDYTDTTANIPAADVKIAMDYRTGNGSTDWYLGGFNARTYDRGPRVTTDVTNYFDTGQTGPSVSGNATFTNGSTSVTFAQAQTLPAGMGVVLNSDYSGSDQQFNSLASSIVAATYGPVADQDIPACATRYYGTVAQSVSR